MQNDNRTVPAAHTCAKCGHEIGGPRWDVCKCDWDGVDRALDAASNLDWISPTVDIALHGTLLERFCMIVAFLIFAAITKLVVLPIVEYLAR